MLCPKQELHTLLSPRFASCESQLLKCPAPASSWARPKVLKVWFNSYFCDCETIKCRTITVILRIICHQTFTDRDLGVPESLCDSLRVRDRYRLTPEATSLSFYSIAPYDFSSSVVTSSFSDLSWHWKSNTFARQLLCPANGLSPCGHVCPQHPHLDCEVLSTASSTKWPSMTVVRNYHSALTF